MLGLGIGAAFFVIGLAGIGPGDAQRWVEDAGVAGPILFVLAGGALGLALFPGHVTAAVAGILFGAVAGTALALAAALLAAALCAVAGRRLGADAVQSLLGPRGRLWRTWLEENGFGAVLASRLAPGTPAGILNYAAGLAGIRLRAILAAVALGALPKTVAYVALGGALSDPLSARGAFAVTLYAGAAVCGAVVARRLLRSRPGARAPRAHPAARRAVRAVAISPTSSVSPAATAMTNAYAASSSGSSSTPFLAMNSQVASQASVCCRRRAGGR